MKNITIWTCKTEKQKGKKKSKIQNRISTNCKIIIKSVKCITEVSEEKKTEDKQINQITDAESLKDIK